MFHLVTGGSGSGKSQFAEDQILAFGDRYPRIYIATMHVGKDPENIRRVQKHRDRRKDMGYETVECEMGLADVTVPEHAVVLLEDMSNLLANEFFMPGGAGAHASEAILSGVRHLLAQTEHVIVVTNELFSDGGVYDTYTNQFLAQLGAINQALAQRADCVTEVVYGIPVTIKSDRSEASL